MTTDQSIREAKARWQRRRRRLIGYGQWQPFVDAAPVRTHVKAIRATGMSLKNIGHSTDVSTPTLDFLIYGDPPYPPAKKIRPETADALLSFWPCLDDYFDTSLVDATGPARRMQALAVNGWTITAIHQHISFVSRKALERIRFNKYVTARLARAVRDFYKWASEGQAETHGVTPGNARRARTYAARYGWPGPTCWDDDTIDDPNAHPEWTGACGTDRGWWLHNTHDIPACQPCQRAHDEWLDACRQLPKRQRFSAYARGKAAASTRGADIAADGRELLAQGLTPDVAATRLGVTRDHLMQELRRHPAEDEAQNAQLEAA